MSHQSLLWSITSPQGKQSWLFGTMHIRDDRAYQLCSDLYPLILQSDAYIGEMDLSQHDLYNDMPRYDIHQYLNDKVYQKVQQQIRKSFRLELDHLAHLHPLMIMSVISTSVLQAEHHISLDEHLWNYAKDHNKPTSGLESYEEQLRILHSIDPGPLYKQLLHISRNPSTIRKHTDKGLDLYMAGRIHQLYMLSKASMQQLRKKVIYDRNRNMASVIDLHDRDLQYFITVGAGHLSGKYGLITLLKKKGFRIKPVKSLSIPEN